MNRHYSDNLPSPLFSKEGFNSSLWKREGRRDFTNKFPARLNNSDRSSPSPAGVRNHGFTLLELIIVIFLIALIFGISAVFFVNSLPAGKFNAAVRDISSSIRHARALAQINGTTQAVTIDIEAKKYGITGNALKPLPPNVRVKVLDPFTQEVVEGQYVFHFGPSGSSDGGTIVVWNDKKTVSIVVDPVVGSTVVKEARP